MKNRYGNEYEFLAVNDNTYKIVGELKYWRYGGQEGEDGIDQNNLGFADPSGGPFISRGFLIQGRKVVRIALIDKELHFEVE
jgi:hypothetical protein